ncbi:16S rRNA (guanine(527)-N(7))-methyltransferase RsmG [Rubricoccus marinus]|uniref:Ribosomal RNA small subunit methyltransferase G n=1 Tax=Rubricoccus marinus TaxID=716817 RepID=A0A259U2G2_9BACT|nr:RsmG family class I SAM-dependent methyltransferase [Rubricoccus marinus]OZC03994.1 hypothetical protein BSZ36_13980 [Rubricoccus marinus]
MTDPIAALSADQNAKLDRFAAELVRMNKHVNLVAPTTLREGELERVHLKHSLALSTKAFPPEAVVVDWGAGGGLPTIPLAIAFPETQFVAVDAVGKKMEAVRTFARRLGLPNLGVWIGRAEAYDGPAPHYCVSRATAPLADLWAWTERVLTPLAEPPSPEAEDVWQPGLLTLKGGNLDEEVAAMHEAHPGLTTSRTYLKALLGPGYPSKMILEVRPEA